MSVRLLRRRIATILEAELGQFAPAAHLWALAGHWVGAGDAERGFHCSETAHGTRLKLDVRVGLQKFYCKGLAFRWLQSSDNAYLKT